MDWFGRSIAKSLKIDEDDEEDDDKNTSIENSSSDQPFSESQSPRGMKEDISELTKTLRTQLWGVASFLAPPSASSEKENHVDETPTPSDHEDEEDLIAGIRNDFVEIGGRFRTGISKLSGNLPVSEFTKIASNFLQLGSEGEDLKNVIGVTEEVVGFAKDLALHPETWLDFPFPHEDDNFDDFELTDAQYDHALAIERLASSLADLRIELCPAYMSENCFWRIYFVLMHPKFSKDDALLLSTPKVLEARALLSHELSNKRNKETVEVPESNDTEAASANAEPLSLPNKPSSELESVKTISVETVNSSETEKHTIESKEIQVIDKPVIEERPEPACHDKLAQTPVTDSPPKVIDVDDEADDWLKEEDDTETANHTTNHLVQDENEDVSFSDLEDDDDDVPVSYKK